jgi:hypothetical protein
MTDNLRMQNSKKSPGAEIDSITEVAELERRIRDGEKLLIQVKSKATTGWISLVVSIGIVIAMAAKVLTYGGVYLIIAAFGLVYVAINIWRIVSAGQEKKVIESELEAYRSWKADLQASFTAAGAGQ